MPGQMRQRLVRFAALAALSFAVAVVPACAGTRNAQVESLAILRRYGLHPASVATVRTIELNLQSHSAIAAPSKAIGLDFTLRSGEADEISYTLRERSSFGTTLTADFVAKDDHVVGAGFPQLGGMAALNDRKILAPPIGVPADLDFREVDGVELFGPWDKDWRHDVVLGRGQRDSLLAVLAESTPSTGAAYSDYRDEEYMLVLTCKSGEEARVRLWTPRGTKAAVLTFDSFQNRHFEPRPELRDQVREILGAR